MERTTSENKNKKTGLYLIDLKSSANLLHTAIEKENVDDTVIYCFTGHQSPKVSLQLLTQYSMWLQKKRLFIIQSPASVTPDTSQSLAFWAGKLTHEYPAETTKIFISSEDDNLYNVLLSLRADGYEVESSWPEPGSVKCDDNILCTIMSVIQSTEACVPDSLEEFMVFLQEKCKIPSYISTESVIKEMQKKGFITIHKGTLIYEPLVFINALEDKVPKKKRSTKKHEDQDGTPFIAPPPFHKSYGTRK